MKKFLTFLVTAFLIAATASAQTNISKQAKLEAHIIALDKSGWEAWKNKDVEWFKNNTAEEFLSITGDGVSDKAAVIKSVPVDCDVKTYSLDDFKVVMLSKTVVLLTYVATQSGTCGNTKLSPKVRASVNYVKRNGKWFEAFYMETPITH